MDKHLKNTCVAALGGFVQWFDNTLFNVLIPLIVYNFVPKDFELSQAFSLLLAYSATLFTRPFGALTFSHLADYHGRKRILAIISFVMGLATLFLAICPSVGLIGVAAPAFLLLFTFLHGFSSGGDWPVASTYLYETNQKNLLMRAGYVSGFCLILGIFLANVLITVLVRFKNELFVGEYSWRFLFILSSCFAFVVSRLRAKLPEKPLATKSSDNFAFWRLCQRHKKKILITFMICSIDGVVFNLFFNTLFPFTDSVTNRAYEFIGTTIALIASYPIFKLAKKWGARKSLQMANIVFMILSSVQFLLNDEGLGIYRLLYVLPGFLYLIPLVGLIPSLFEKSCRAFLVGLSRNISIFLFGGVGLLLMRFYFKPSGCLLAGYILGTALISFWGMHLLPRQSEEF